MAADSEPGILSHGIARYFAGDPSAALRIFSQACAAGGGDARPWEGVALRRLGRREEAVAALRGAASPAQGMAPPWTLAAMGEALRELGGRRRGYAEIQKLLREDPQARSVEPFLRAEASPFEAWAFGCRGGALRSAGDLEGALALLERAVDLDAGCGWSWGWLGEILLRLERLAQASDALNRAVGLFAEWPEAFAWRGEVLRRLGRDEEALRDLDHAVALGYRQYDVYVSRAALRQARSDSEGYLRELACAVRAAPEVFRAQARGLPDPAAARWIGGVLRRSERAGDLLRRAERESGKGRWARARVLLLACVRADPSNARARLRLSEEAARRQLAEEAMAHAQRAVESDPCAETYARRADLAQKSGYLEASLRDLSVALALSPSITLYEWRARAFLGMRHYDLALKDISAALELEPDSAALYDLRAHVNLILGRLLQAQGDLERALRILPRQVNLHLRLGQVLALRGRGEEALASLEPIRGESPAWASFAAGYIQCIRKSYGRAAEEFRSAAGAAAESDVQLKSQAHLYGSIALAFGAMGKEDTMMRDGRVRVPKARDAADKGKVYLCGLGVYPPQTATVEVLRGISECDVIFNNLPGLGISEFLGLFCANRRPVAFRYEQDAKLCADLVLSEVRPGRTVGFITFGHPLLFGPLSHEIIRRCRLEGIACKAFGAVSSMDAVLAASGQVLGYSYRGFQVFETTSIGVLKDLSAANPRLPIVIYFADGMGEEGLSQVTRALRRLHPPGHRCMLFGPRHELWETTQEEVRVGDLDRIVHHKLAQGILFVPPRETGRRTAPAARGEAS